MNFAPPSGHLIGEWDPSITPKLYGNCYKKTP